jgi:hypothetical protein
MDACLNLLNRPEVFIPTAALLALVLLVWVQLHIHGKGPRSVNWICGVAWAYLAILSALTAVALFIHNPTSTCAKGFLILAFFMTGINIITLFVLNVADLLWGLSRMPNKSLFGESAKSKCWGLAWLATFFGLLLVSLSLVDICPCLWTGIALVLSAVLAIFVIVWWQRIRRRSIFWVLFCLVNLIGLAIIVLSLVFGWVILGLVIGVELVVVPYLAIILATRRVRILADLKCSLCTFFRSMCSWIRSKC